MTPHRRLQELDDRLAHIEEPNFAAGWVGILIDEIDRFAIEIGNNPTAPNAVVFAREIRVNCRAAREGIAEWRERMQKHANV